MTHETPSVSNMAAAASASATTESRPELGDAIDSIEDAALTLKRAVRNETDALVDEARGIIREQPLTAIAFVGAIAYLYGRFLR